MLFQIMTTAIATVTGGDGNPCTSIIDINECFNANRDFGCRWFRTGTGENPDEGFCEQDVKYEWPDCDSIEDPDECGAVEVCAWETQDLYSACTFNRAAEEKLCAMSADEDSCYENPGSCFWTKEGKCDCVSCKGDRNFCELTMFVKDSFPFAAMMHCMLEKCDADPVKTDLCLRSFPETPQDAIDICDKNRCDCLGGYFDEDGFCVVSSTEDIPHPCTTCEGCTDLEKLKCNADRAICFHEATHLQVSPTHCSDVFQCMAALPDLNQMCKSHRDVKFCPSDFQDAMCPSHEILFQALSKSLNSL